MGMLRAVIVAHGDLDGATLDRALAGPPCDGSVVIAADAGARRAEALGVLPDLVVGDADSLTEGEVARLGGMGVPVERASVDKDESDTELAILAALERGASEIRLVGALGGSRVEHTVANLLLLAHPALDGTDMAILAGPSDLRRMGTQTGPGAIEVVGSPGDFVSLLPLDTVVEEVRTQGLRYPLHGESLHPGPARGLSNELLGTSARVTTGRGRLLVIHTEVAS
jgi:thiamine pyrophosphokinase